MESRSVTERSTHNTTLPFTRFLAGHADYTPVLFGERRRETSWSHQIATAAVFTSALMTYAAHPKNILVNPGVEMIKSIPSIWDETIAQYKQKVLAAFQETSDALIARKTLAARRTALASQVMALERSAGLALDRYENGRASYFEVLEAQQLLFPAQDELARNQRDQLIAVVNLYKALGGGWNAGEPAATPEAKPLQAQVEVETGE